MRRRLPILRCAGILTVLLLAACTDPVRQPLGFNHKKHTEADVECSVCHQHFETAEFSGLPSTGLCMDCHEGETSTDSEAQKLLKYAANEENIPWQRVYDVPDHVFYSHRRHVVVAEIDCVVCHGAIAELTVPPAYPLVDQTMDWCLDCHAARGATTDCIHCHR